MRRQENEQVFDKMVDRTNVLIWNDRGIKKKPTLCRASASEMILQYHLTYVQDSRMNLSQR